MKQESEKLLQEAKDKYPVGTRFISIYQQKEITSNGNFVHEELTTFEGEDCIYCNGWDVYRGGKWAEIIFKPEQSKPFKIEVGGEYQTRDGREVRIYATDGAGKFPVHGAIINSEGMWKVKEWTNEGKWIEKREGHDNDLIPKPKKPLSFTEWFDSLKLDITRDHNGYGIWSDSILNEKVKQYLNDFNK